MKPPSEPHGIMCHYFHGEGFPVAQGSLSPDDFQRGLDIYGHRLISADVWIDKCLNGELEDECCVTFDDGLMEAYSVALPILENRGLTAAWNIYTGPLVGVPNSMEAFRTLRNYAFGSVEEFYKQARALFGYSSAPVGYLADRGYLTQDDRDFRWWRDFLTAEEYEERMVSLMTIAGALTMGDLGGSWIGRDSISGLAVDGHVIGIHTHSHPVNMGMLSHEQQALEYATAKYILEGITEGDIRTASHPRGLVSPFGMGWLKQHGFELCWGATMDGKAPWNTPRWSTGYWRD